MVCHVGRADSLTQMAALYPESRWLEKEEGDQQTLAIPLDEDLDVVLTAPGTHSARLDMKSLRPDSGAAWRHSDTAQYQDCVDSSCVSFVHTSYRQKGTNNAHHIFYAYFVEDRILSSKLSYRLVVGWSRMPGREPTTGLIGFIVRGDLPELFSITREHQLLVQRMITRPHQELVSNSLVLENTKF